MIVVSFSALAESNENSVIFHPSCKVIVKEAINYRGRGDYTDLRGPLKGYAQILQDSLINDSGYVDTKTSNGAIIITLRSSYADFYTHKKDGYSMKKVTSFCYVEAESAEFSDIGFYQESRNCKKSLRNVIEQIPKCKITPN